MNDGLATGGSDTAGTDAGTIAEGGITETGSTVPEGHIAVTVEGKEHVVSLQDQDKLKELLGKGLSSTTRFQESKGLMSKADQRFSEATEMMNSAKKIQTKYGENAIQAAIDAAEESGDEAQIEKVEQLAEEFLAKRIRLRMADPSERARIEAEKRAETAEKKIKSREDYDNKVKSDTAKKAFVQQFNSIIVQALDKAGVQRNEHTVKEMAGLIRTMRQKGIPLNQINPARLADHVRDGNNGRVASMFTPLATEIQTAFEAKDSTKVVELGGKIVSMLNSAGEGTGDLLMKAIAQYHISKLRGGTGTQPNTLPGQTLETQRLTEDDNAPTQYKTMDDEADDRRRRAKDWDNARRRPAARV